MSEARAPLRPRNGSLPQSTPKPCPTIWTDSFTRNEQGEFGIDGVTVSDLVAGARRPQYVFSRQPSAPAPAPTAPLLSRLSPRTVRR